jgi:uncharacterized protein YecT (DUF1311 family)
MRIVIALGFLFVAMVTGPAAAQQSRELKACFDIANTQVEINACAGEDLKRAKSEQTRVYQELLAKLQRDPVARRKVEAAQQAWIAFRDAHLQELFPKEDKSSYGSVYPMSIALASAEVTRQRTTMLRDILHPALGSVGPE